MKESLQERCEAQIRNETALRKAAKFDYEQVIKLCAMMHVNAGREVDAERIKECRTILKSKTGAFSGLRGTLQRVVLTKMALADDPSAYIDDVIATYDQLAAGRKITSEMLSMAATTIVDNCPPEQRSEVVEKTRKAYARMKELHPFLTSDNDMSLIALMIMAGKDPNQAAEEAEGLLQAMRDSRKISQSVAKSVAMVLSLSEKPADQKLEGFFGLYDACKAAHHETAKDKAMVIYAAFADADYDLNEVVAAIGEVDDWLKGQTNYGAIALGASIRRLFATSLVLEDLQAGSTAAMSSVAGAVTQAVVEELLLILVTIIVTSTIISMTVTSTFD